MVEQDVKEFLLAMGASVGVMALPNVLISTECKKPPCIKQGVGAVLDYTKIWFGVFAAFGGVLWGKKLFDDWRRET